MAKQVLQTIMLVDGKETSLPWLEKDVQPRLPETILFLVNALAVYLRSRRRRESGQSFIPRQSHERESRLEFARFIHW